MKSVGDDVHWLPGRFKIGVPQQIGKRCWLNWREKRSEEFGELAEALEQRKKAKR